MPLLVTKISSMLAGYTGMVFPPAERADGVASLPQVPPARVLQVPPLKRPEDVVALEQLRAPFARTDVIPTAQSVLEVNSPEKAQAPRTPAPALAPRQSPTQIGISLLAAIIALPSYFFLINRGTPHRERQHSVVTRVVESLFPDRVSFPNNRAAWVLSTLNSGSLFALSVLQTVKSGATPFQAALSLSMIGIYALGAAYLCHNSFRYPAEAHRGDGVTGARESSHRPAIKAVGDWLCSLPRLQKVLLGTVVGTMGLGFYAGLARMGIVPAGKLPIELIGIGINLGVRAVPLYLLGRELLKHARAVDVHRQSGAPLPQGDRPVPALLPHAFWNASSAFNLLSIPVLFSTAAITPIGVALQNAAVGACALRLRRAKEQEVSRQR